MTGTRFMEERVSLSSVRSVVSAFFDRVTKERKTNL